MGCTREIERKGEKDGGLCDGDGDAGRGGYTTAVHHSEVRYQYSRALEGVEGSQGREKGRIDSSMGRLGDRDGRDEDT